MSRTTRWTIPAAILLASSVTVQAQDTTPAASIFKDADSLNDACTSDDDADINACDWFIMGVWDTMGYFADFEVTERYVCVADGTNVSELREKVIIELSTANLSTSAVSVTINALTNYFPCED